MAIRCKDEEAVAAEETAAASEVEEETEETARTRPTAVTVPTLLGKSLKAVQSVNYDNLVPGVGSLASGSPTTLQVASLGNGHLRTERPPDIADPFRAEFKKFWTTDPSALGGAALVYVNSSFDAEAESYNSDIREAYGDTVFSAEAVGEETSEILEGDLFPTFSQAWEIEGSELVFKQYFSSEDGTGTYGDLDSAKGEGTSEELWGTFIWGEQTFASDEYKFGAVEDFKRSAPLIPWGEYQNGTQINVPEFSDHYFEFNIPFSKKELAIYINNVNNPASVAIESDYDFYQANYEGTILTDTIPEGILPNLYSLFSQDANFTQQQQSLISTVPRASTKKDYLQSWAAAVKDPNNADIIDELSKKFQSVAIPSAQIGRTKMISGFRQYEALFPMNINTTLTTEDSGQIMEALEDSRLVDEFLKASINEFSRSTLETTLVFEEVPGWNTTPAGAIMSEFGLTLIQNAFASSHAGIVTFNESDPQHAPPPGKDDTPDIRKFAESPIHSFSNFAQSKEIVTFQGGFGDEGSTQKSAVFSEGALEMIDFGQWMKQFSNSSYEVRDDFWDETIFLGIPPNAIEQSADCQSFANTLAALILTGKVNTIMQSNENIRTWTEMLQGVPCVNETLVYEVVQRDANDTVNSIQNIFIPNTSELSLMQYFDTQAKYNKPYIYEVYAHQLVIGTKYKYWSALIQNTPIGWARYFFDNPRSDNLTDLKHQFGVDYTPSLKVVRIPIYTQSITLLDNAPMPPNIDLIPYKDISCKFLINLHGAAGDLKAYPITITEDDTVFNEQYRTSRNLDPWEKFTYSSDDPVGRFEIFRLDAPPRSYADFANSLLTTIGSTDVSSASYISTITPNKKYYYMFRGIDIHNNKSYPSDIYQVELTDNNGIIGFNVSIFKMSPSSLDTRLSSTKEFSRYLKINPNMLQSLVDYQASRLMNASSATDTKNPPILGRAKKSVWNKKYKIRVTSKNSGRKFDINLTCKVKYRPKVRKQNSE